MATAAQTCDSCKREIGGQSLQGQGPIQGTREGIAIEAVVRASKDGKPADLCLPCLRAILANAVFPEATKPGAA